MATLVAACVSVCLMKFERMKSTLFQQRLPFIKPPFALLKCMSSGVDVDGIAVGDVVFFDVFYWLFCWNLGCLNIPSFFYLLNDNNLKMVQKRQRIFMYAVYHRKLKYLLWSSF